MNLKKLQKHRHQAYLRQSFCCYYCALPMWEDDPAQFNMRYGVGPRKAKHLRCTAEHLVAQRDGGGEDELNIAAACLWCNRMRHRGRPDKAPDPEKYKRRVTKLIEQRRWHPAVAVFIQGQDPGNSTAAPGTSNRPPFNLSKSTTQFLASS